MQHATCNMPTDFCFCFILDRDDAHAQDTSILFIFGYKCSSATLVNRFAESLFSLSYDPFCTRTAATSNVSMTFDMLLVLEKLKDNRYFVSWRIIPGNVDEKVSRDSGGRIPPSFPS
jgi:hypothetical protein